MSGEGAKDKAPAGDGSLGLSAAAGKNMFGSSIWLKQESLLHQMLQAMAGQAPSRERPRCKPGAPDHS